MKIEKSSQDYGDRIQLESATRASEARNRANAAEAQRTGSRDVATVSDRARLLAQAHAEVDRTATQKSDRVNSLHDQVASGQYQVPYAALAAKLYGQFKNQE